MTLHPDEQARELDWQAAAKRVDWMQILLNLMNGQETGRDGQPCFFIGGGHFCGRAKFWAGHDDQHKFVSLLDLLASVQAKTRLAEAEWWMSKLNWSWLEAPVPLWAFLLFIAADFIWKLIKDAAIADLISKVRP